MQQPLMNKAVAVWLVKNTSLTFKQIADFCFLHELEIQAIADGEDSKFLNGVSPIVTGETTEAEIKKCEDNPELSLNYFSSEEYEKFRNKAKQSSKKTKFKSKDKLDGVLWVLNHYPTISDSDVSKLFSTTVNVVKAIRAKSHWNYKNLVAKNPITLGLCSEESLHNIIVQPVSSSN